MGKKRDQTTLAATVIALVIVSAFFGFFISKEITEPVKLGLKVKPNVTLVWGPITEGNYDGTSSTAPVAAAYGGNRMSVRLLNPETRFNSVEDFLNDSAKTDEINGYDALYYYKTNELLLESKEIKGIANSLGLESARELQDLSDNPEFVSKVKKECGGVLSTEDRKKLSQETEGSFSKFSETQKEGTETFGEYVLEEVDKLVETHC